MELLLVGKDVGRVLFRFVVAAAAVVCDGLFVVVLSDLLGIIVVTVSDETFVVVVAGYAGRLVGRRVGIILDVVVLALNVVPSTSVSSFSVLTDWNVVNLLFSVVDGYFVIRNDEEEDDATNCCVVSSGNDISSNLVVA